MEQTMLEKIEQRLIGWGYTMEDIDFFAVEFLISKVENYIHNYCNIAETPKELEETEIDMICVEFLKGKALSGGLDLSGIQIDSISSITEGDVSVSYSGGSTCVLSQHYEDMKRKFEADLIPFRAMRW